MSYMQWLQKVLTHFLHNDLDLAANGENCLFHPIMHIDKVKTHAFRNVCKKNWNIDKSIQTFNLVVL